ncbi:E3 ubiquitin-protein ligase RNF144B isoform X2 [Manis javanica]|uniref:E3 ubiquitin-protein ligase RNF144B isoform X2 n=1 Tax=Manis javanica TaxID=9974 RepID=UPI003C6D56D8
MPALNAPSSSKIFKDVSDMAQPQALRSHALPPAEGERPPGEARRAPGARLEGPRAAAGRAGEEAAAGAGPGARASGAEAAAWPGRTPSRSPAPAAPARRQPGPSCFMITRLGAVAMLSSDTLLSPLNRESAEVSTVQHLYFSSHHLWLKRQLEEYTRVTHKVFTLPDYKCSLFHGSGILDPEPGSSGEEHRSPLSYHRRQREKHVVPHKARVGNPNENTRGKKWLSYQRLSTCFSANEHCRARDTPGSRTASSPLLVIQCRTRCFRMPRPPCVPPPTCPVLWPVIFKQVILVWFGRSLSSPPHP